MSVEQSYDEWRKSEDEKARILLEHVGRELVAAGFRVNWSASKTSSEPGLIVNGTCLIRTTFPEGVVMGKFWNQVDANIQSAITRVLSNRVRFADYTFDLGGPVIGESLK